MALDDPTAARTMFIGILIGFAIYAMSFVLPFLVRESWAQWASIALVVVSMVFVISWFVATRRGFRVVKEPNRVERRLKERQADEREKMRKARMRR